MESLYDLLPAAGYIPVRVRIESTAPEARAWRLEFFSGEIESWSPRRHRYQVVLEAPALDTRQIELLVPQLGWIGHEPELHLHVTGPGVDAWEQVNGPMGRIPGTVRRGLSTGVSARVRSRFSEELEDQVATTTLASDLEPTSWRALVGFDAIWLDEAYLRALPPISRRALGDWVLQGGDLTVLHGQRSPSLPLELGAVDLEDGRLGFGRVRLLPYDPQATLEPGTMQEHLPTPRANLYADSELSSHVPAIGLNRPLMALLLGAFFLLAGPANVLYVRRTGRIHALLWTTPCLALGASVLLGLAILLQDGTGGSGTRYAAYLVVPELGREVAVQEQISRTGVLVDTAFTAEPDVYLDRYHLHEERHASWQLESFAGGFAGDWFRTRAVQAHLIEHVRASRTRVEWAPRVAGTDPELVSSLPVAIERIYYVDPDGNVWSGSNLWPGEKIALRPGDDIKELRKALDALPPGTLLSRLLRDEPRRGYFYALPGERTPAMTPTLASIEWDDRVALYLGPLAAPPAGSQP